MTLKVLEIISLDGIRIGRLRLNGEYGTILRRAELKSPYNKMLANMELLTKNKDYSYLGFETYVSNLKKDLSEKTGLKLEINERKLNPKIEKLLIKYYSGSG